MKNIISLLLIVFIGLLFTTNCYSQEKEDDMFDETLKNWIFASTSYVEENSKIVPKPVNQWMLKTFYAYPREKGIYKSFNGSLYKFLTEHFKEELINEKLYFIQEYAPYGCSNNSNYYILNSSNQLNKVTNDFVGKSGWKIKKSTVHDFQGFNEKFNSYSDFEKTQSNDNAIYSYYIITEFNKTSVRIKILTSYLEL